MSSKGRKRRGYRRLEGCGRARTHRNTVEVNSLQLLVGRKLILGWYSGYAKDSEETLAFSRLSGVEAMVEEYPLERVNEAFDKMMNGKPRFKVVLDMGL